MNIQSIYRKARREAAQYAPAAHITIDEANMLVINPGRWHQGERVFYINPADETFTVVSTETGEPLKQVAYQPGSTQIYYAVRGDYKL